MFEIQSPNQVLSQTDQANIHADENTVVVGIIIPRTGSLIFDDHYHLELIQGIAEECNKKEYTVILFLFHSSENKEDLYTRLIQPGFCNGLIVSSSTQPDDPLMPFLSKNEFKFVTIGKQPNLPQISYVDVDNEQGAYIAVNHLIKQGHQRIATITGPQNMAAGISRYQGYLNALKEHNLILDNDLVIEGQFTQNSGYDGMEALLPHQPDAVFIASDTMALGALQAINKAGLSVPHDIAIVGFDDIKTAAITSPPITTIRQPISETGKIAVSLLLDTLEKESSLPQHKILDTELIIRQSCGSSLKK